MRAHLVIDAGAGVTLPGSALAPNQVLRFALHCLADTVTTHHAPVRAQYTQSLMAAEGNNVVIKHLRAIRASPGKIERALGDWRPARGPHPG